MAINLSHLKIYLSGGTTNTVAAKSLGGPISATRVLSQTATGLTTISGVTIDDAAGNTVGTGTLTYTYSTTAPTLTWTPPSGTSGTAVDVSVDGTYAIQGGSNGGLLFVTVVASLLPGSSQSNTITIANQTNKVWDDVSKAEALAGATEYRCLYFKNTHPSDSVINLKLWRGADTPGQDVITVEVDPVGVNGTADGCYAGSKSISGVTWGTSAAVYTSTSHGYIVGDVVTIAGITPSGYNGTFTLTAKTDDTFTVALTPDPGSYSTGGTAKKVVETTAPATVTWSNSAVSEATALSVGTLGPGQYAAFWQRRVVPANTDTTVAENTSKISFKAYL